MIKKLTLAASVSALATSAAFAGGHCNGSGISSLSAAFPAVEALQDQMEACGATTERDQEHKDKINPALEASPAAYNAVLGANSTFTAANSAGLVAAITDVPGVSDLPVSMKVEQDGEVVAIATMANAQHLMVRQDVLDATGMAMPTTYEEVVALASKAQEMGLMEYPLTGTYAAGWNLGEEFMNMWQGTGEPMFVNGTESNINNAAGIATLEMMKALTDLMNPEFLTFNSDIVQAQFEQGEAGIANLWGTRAQKVIDGVGALGADVVMGGAPTFGGGSTPATTIWWDGFFFAANQSDEELAAAVDTAIHAAASVLSVDGNAELAVWVIDGYEPTPAAAGVFASAAAGANPYPMLPHVGAMHTAAGAELADFLSGNESAAQALADIEAAYNAAMAEN
ncbi:MAG: ABC transporter substrate-binding protein [Alphaproteobacteria bacterium]